MKRVNPENEFEGIPFGISLKEFKQFLYPLCSDKDTLNCKIISVYKVHKVYRIDIKRNNSTFEMFSLFFINDILQSIKAITSDIPTDINKDFYFKKFVEMFEHIYDISKFEILMENGFFKEKLKMTTDHTSIIIGLKENHIEAEIKKLPL